jgi:outer membrane scaffolding protein for murein synthesis (MipA/OmpV family)
MRCHPRAVIAFTALMVSAAPALAQSRASAARPNSVFIGVSGGVQQGANDLSDHFSFSKNQETETIDVKYPMKPRGLFDISGSFRVWKGLAFGAAFSRASGSGTAEVTASVPHPFFFNQPRTVTGTEDGIQHAENGVHLQVQYLVPASDSVRVIVGAGPSWLSVEHEIVTDVTVTESYPYDTAAFGGAVTKATKASATGFNAGVDVTWMFARSVGVGGLVRYTRADVDLEPAPGRTLTMKAGGVQAGAGIRVVF